MEKRAFERGIDRWNERGIARDLRERERGERREERGERREERQRKQARLQK